MILGIEVDNAPTIDYDSSMSRKLPFSEILRRTIERSEKSRYRISQETGIDKGVLSHFVHGHRGLSLDTVDKLVDCLGLEITTRTKSATKKRREK